MKDILKLDILVKYQEQDHVFSQNGINTIIHSRFLYQSPIKYSFDFTSLAVTCDTEGKEKRTKSKAFFFSRGL